MSAISDMFCLITQEREELKKELEDPVAQPVFNDLAKKKADELNRDPPTSAGHVRANQAPGMRPTKAGLTAGSRLHSLSLRSWGVLASRVTSRHITPHSAPPVKHVAIQFTPDPGDVC